MCQLRDLNELNARAARNPIERIIAPILAAMIIIISGWVSSAMAATIPNPNCFLGVDNKTTLAVSSFADVVRGSSQPAITKTAQIMGSCAANADLPRGNYQWTLTRKTLSFTAVTGGATKKVVDSVGRSFNISPTTIVVSPSGWPGRSPTYSATADATAGLSGLSVLPAGQYLLTQAFEVQREICSWTLTWWMAVEFKCVNDGPKQNFTARYTLNVILPNCAVEWAYGNLYREGQVVSYDGVNYKNIQWHIAYFGTYWTPPRTPALWEYMTECVLKPVEPAPPVTPPVTTPEPPPAGGAGTSPSPGRGVKQNPWTVRGYAAKRRCEVCDEMRGWH